VNEHTRTGNVGSRARVSNFPRAHNTPHKNNGPTLPNTDGETRRSLRAGIIHRDLCPENVCMGRGLMANEVYLMDLGLAEQYTEMMTGVHRLSDAKSGE